MSHILKIFDAVIHFQNHIIKYTVFDILFFNFCYYEQNYFPSFLISFNFCRIPTPLDLLISFLKIE